jgi:hypothetical protein
MKKTKPAPSHYWQYRIIRKIAKNQLTKEVSYYYNIHEVYFKNNAIFTWSTDPMYPHDETPKGLKQDHNLMAKAFKLPILEVKGNKLVPIKTKKS